MGVKAQSRLQHNIALLLKRGRVKPQGCCRFPTSYMAGRLRLETQAAFSLSSWVRCCRRFLTLVGKGATWWDGPRTCQDLMGNPCCRWVVCPFAGLAVLLLYKISKQFDFVHVTQVLRNSKAWCLFCDAQWTGDISYWALTTSLECLASSLLTANSFLNRPVISFRSGFLLLSTCCSNRKKDTTFDLLELVCCSIRASSLSHFSCDFTRAWASGHDRLD